MATVTVHNGIDSSYLFIDYSFSVSGRNWTCTASLKLQMGPTYNFEAWNNVCGNAATLRKDGGTMPGGGRPLRNNTYTLAGPIQVGSGTYDTEGHAPSVSVSWAWNVNSSWGGYVCPHGDKTLTGSPIGPSYVVPTCTAPNITEVTPSTVKGTFAVSSWGGTSAGYIAARLFGPSGSGRLEQQTSGVSSYTTIITNGSVQLDGGTTIKGAGIYYADTYASNSAGGANSSRVTVNTPPAELASITYEQTAGATDVSIVPKITGGNSTVNASGAVTTSYRYSTNGGSTWSGWTAISGTATAWTEKTGSAFTCNYGASVKIQAKQTFNTKESAVKEVSFTATTGTAPSGGTLTVDSSTWNSITLTAAGVDYGKPDGISGRKLAIGVSGAPDNINYKLENQVQNVTGATTTVDNNSIHPSDLALVLKGMLPVYPYVWAWNTVTSTFVVRETTAYYLPPAPGSASYTEDGNDEYTISFTGVPANNDPNYTAADLTRTVRYKIDSGSWVYVDNDTQKALDAVTSETITVNPQHNATVECWLTYKGKESTHNTFMIVNSNDPVFLYGSVNGESTRIRHFYGSVNGETAKVTKIYASVDGVARKVFEDV